MLAVAGAGAARLLPQASPFIWAIGTASLVSLWLFGVSMEGRDDFAYWSVSTSVPYAIAEGEGAAFLYPPPAVFVAAPFSLLPWPVFHAAWIGLLVLCVAWLVPPRWWVVGAIAASLEIVVGNIHLLMAVALVLAIRTPAAWAFPLLTKVTPGIGVLWAAGARRWRDAAIALAVTSAIVLVSLVVVPNWWNEWLVQVSRSADGGTIGGEWPIPVLYRLPVAAILVVWGGATGRAWVLAPAAWLALPNLWPIALPALLLAVFRLRRQTAP